MMFSSSFVTFLHQAEPAPTWSPLLLFGIIGAIFYFLVFAPARKRQKALQQTLDALKKGDRVVTTGGIYGEVSSVEGSMILLKIADSVRIKIAKSAVAGLQSDSETESRK